VCIIRELEWVGSSLRDLKEFPQEVMQEIGYSLYEVQIGKKPSNAKPLVGFDLGIMEIVSDFDKNTYRAVYALKLWNKIYVLHSFQKKSKCGVKTPKQDVDLIKRRIAAVKRRIENEDQNCKIYQK
jgi:phage-related protein